MQDSVRSVRCMLNGFEGADIRLTTQCTSIGHTVFTCRRSKQLRRLGGLLSGKVAQAATHTWRDHSRLLLLVALVAHVACFAALSGQLHRRHQ